MEDYGADCVYVTDSGGALDMDGYRERLAAYDAVLRPETQRGIHAHHNLALGVANAMVGAQCGAVRIDASLAGRRTPRWLAIGMPDVPTLWPESRQRKKPAP
jgi:4-hydroxy 2-oxovalerate aldolase